MNTALFLARRLYRGQDKDKQISRPAVVIAMIGIAIGLAVMIMAVAIVAGFKQHIQGQVVGFGSDIQILNADILKAYDSNPVQVTDGLWRQLTTDESVAHVQRYATKTGMLKTDDGFQGVLLKGIAAEYDLSFMRKNMVEGEFPAFSDSAFSGKIVASQTIARKLGFGVGDKINVYFIQDNIRVRRFQVAGLYQTNLSEFDNVFLFTDMYLVNRLNRWQPDQVSGLEVKLRKPSDASEKLVDWTRQLSFQADAYGQVYHVMSIRQLYPNIFAWLDVLNVNIWVILALMIGISGFTMISGLLILIIERTQMIGVLKSLGANNTLVRRVFLWLAVFIIVRGMLWGNVIGISLCLLQQHFGLFKLDPATYYMDTVPVLLNGWHLLLINIGTFVLSVCMMVGPSYMISHIHPAQSMRYE